MEDVSLSETESRYFSDLFVCCDVEKTGKIPMMKAKELYRSANLADSVISEIISLAGIPETALHISRAQFYSCLKLIAAHQVGTVPLRQELIAATVLLPLPRFSWKESPNINEAIALHQHSHALQFNQANGLNAIPPPPVSFDRRNSFPRRCTEWHSEITLPSRRNTTVAENERNQLDQEAAANSDVLSTDSEIEQTESSCGADGSGGGDIVRNDVCGDESGGNSVGGSGDLSCSNRDIHRRRGSPEAWSTNSDSPTPTNSVAERPWAKETMWQGLLGDEHRQLLGTEEESSDRHSSEDDNETDIESIYVITPEQREYYFKQFKAVQHDINGLLSGQVARVFFEKSRIPVEELRHIWQLCDVTRDGALSLAEFTAAMHLVVLRRNNIPLPAMLPSCLHPNVLQHSTLTGIQLPPLPKEPPEADLLHLNDEDEEDNTDNTIVSSNTTANTVVSSSRVSNEKNTMSLSALSASSQASTSSRQAVGNHLSTTLTTPSLPPSVRHESASNSPTVETADTPPALPATAKLNDRNLWPADVPPTQWTKFTESPTSNVSSPGLKPVNFDMQRTAQAVVSDPQILHPVALRVTPIGATSSTCTTDSITQGDGEGTVSAPCESPKLQQQVVSIQSNDLRAIQRPQAKKLPVKNIGALPPPPQRESNTVCVVGSITSTLDCGISASSSGGGGDASSTGSVTVVTTTSQQLPLQNKKDQPPLPPPRPHRHGRSSSLDLNKLKMSAPSCGTQPEITTQASFDLQITTGFADFTNFVDNPTNSNDRIPEQQQHSLPVQMNTSTTASIVTIPAPPRLALQSSQRVSAFEVYRKPNNSARTSQSPTVTIQTQPYHQVPLIPFGAIGATAIAQQSLQSPFQMAGVAPFLNAEVYERRVNAISETLRHVSFKEDSSNMTDVLRHLREQNNLLLRLCNDLSDELLTVQTRKEELRMKLGLANAIATNSQTSASGSVQTKTQRTGSSISAPVLANVTGGSGSSGIHSNVEISNIDGAKDI